MKKILRLLVICSLFSIIMINSNSQVFASKSDKSVKITSAKNNGEGIKIKWDVVLGATSYVVYRSTDNGKLEKYDVVYNKKSYLDENVNTGEVYKYAVKAMRGKHSYKISKETKEIIALPMSVDSVVATKDKNDNFKLTWNVNPCASGYYIYRSSDNKNWKKIDTLYENVGEYKDKSVNSGDDENSTNKIYLYKIKPFEIVDGVTYSGLLSEAYGMAAQAYGVDVSHHNGNIDWKKMKNAGVEFAMIRVGYGDDKKGGILDRQFKRNIKNAAKNDIKIGIYMFSYADNTKEAVKEAEFVIKQLKKYNIDYPIAFDFENNYRRKRRLKSKNTKIAVAFCRTIEKAGYDAIVYSDANYFKECLDAKKLSKYGLWVARWTYNKKEFKDYDLSGVKIWQYSDKGKISRCSEALDLNVSFMCK